jgi:hypothetical protein
MLSSTIIKPQLTKSGKRSHHAWNENRLRAGTNKFVGVDGEGIYVAGEHKYALLGVGDRQLVNPNGLDWQSCFEFLYGQYEKGTAFVGFFLGYDFNQIFKTLPEERARRLLTEEGRASRQRRGRNPAPWPVEADGWEFDILGMKRLRLRPKLCDCLRERGKPQCKCARAPWMSVCDAGSFFQQSFLKVIEPSQWIHPVVSDDEYALILEGKRRRAEATEVTPEMKMYNRLENDVLCRVMRQLDAGFREIDVYLPPAKWFGPGQAAQSWLVNERVIKASDLLPKIPDYALEAARKSYYGGWFEIMMHGTIPGVTHEYDINSAYPHIIAQLPCLEHGKWSRGNGLPSVKDGDLCLVYARVWTGAPYTNKRHHIGAMLHRTPDGNICRPTHTEGWFWWHELDAAIRAKCVQKLRASPANPLHPRCYEWVKYEPCDCYPPMRRVANLYLKRQAVGKDSPLGKGAKLTYNSAYGKFAQSVGSPVFGNPVYASLITAGCRAMILDAIATHPKGKQDVAMVATDAVYFVSSHPGIPTGKGLGEWDHTERHNLTQFKPGVYWDDEARERVAQGADPNFKARGIKASDFGGEIARIDRDFGGWNGTPPAVSSLLGPSPGWPEVRFTVAFAMTSCLQAIRQGEWSRAGAVSDSETRKQSSNPWQKRDGVYFDGTYYRSEPLGFELCHKSEAEGWEPFWDVASTPYEKRFGMDDPWSLEYRESMGLTPDGNAYELIGYAWKGLTE